MGKTVENSVEKNAKEEADMAMIGKRILEGKLVIPIDKLKFFEFREKQLSPLAATDPDALLALEDVRKQISVVKEIMRSGDSGTGMTGPGILSGLHNTPH